MMMNEPALFDPSRTVPTVCPVGHCQAIRLPDQDRVVPAPVVVLATFALVVAFPLLVDLAAAVRAVVRRRK